jgi:acetyl/propionyl-CoA carboxylase alpha subunit
MRRLGAKSDAKTLAIQEQVPIVPGCFEPGVTAERLKSAAGEIGYPIMLKASAGGGGRGMRVVRDPGDFDNELAIATDEALKAFGDGAMMVEKLVERPRHIEVQILADSHGNVACLFERECSLQRRHQKLVEESASPYLANHPETWQKMAAASKRLALAAGYVGAGTVEFMVDEAAHEFYFLEVNTRLQVEHPVTEAITGLDLVRWQLNIANGKPLELDDRLTQGDRSAIFGHAIETRIVAEDPAVGFLPSVGKILAWLEPEGPGVRVDTGFGPNAEVSRFYDSLIAKVIVHAGTRASAIHKLRLALLDFHVLGVKTNIGYLLDVLAHPDFAAGKMDTGFLGREFADWSPGTVPIELGALAAAASNPVSGPTIETQKINVWSASDGFRNR